MNFNTLYNDKEQTLMSLYGLPVSPMQFYKELFPSGSFEREGHPEDKKPNGIIIDIKEKAGEREIERTFIHEGNAEIKRKLHRRTAITAPVGYYGLQRTNHNASVLFAFVFDIDGVGAKQIQQLYHYTYELKEGFNYTKPTYIVNSGGGLHLYFILEEPLPLRPQDLAKYNLLKKALLPSYWNEHTSTDDSPQYQGVTQGFRLVGSKTSRSDKHILTAYRSGEKITIQDLIERGLWSEYSIEKYKQTIKVTTPLATAKKKWPEWYKKRIEEKQAPGRWNVKRDLYDWWLRKIGVIEQPTTGHRYFRLMCLAAYAMKCNIEYEELEKDALALLPKFDNDINNPFTKSDVIAALKVYSESYLSFPRHTIETISAIDIPPNTRKYRNQKQHMQIISGIRDILYPDGDWRKKNGRPSAKQDVENYLHTHPGETNKSKIARELKLHRNTVAKHMEVV